MKFGNKNEKRNLCNENAEVNDKKLNYEKRNLSEMRIGRNLRRVECIPHGIEVDKMAITRIDTIRLVCVNCGYVEFYVENEKDLEKINKKFRKVEILKGNLLELCY